MATTTAPTRTLSDLIVDYLEQFGVEYVFGIPGGHISSLYEALARSEKRGGPRAILTRHETGAAYMADGYARETGKLGVCCATTSPGTSNLITGVAAAYADHIPLLVITAQTASSQFGWGDFQESSPDTIDIAGMLRYCTRYHTIITHANQLERKLIAALTTAFQSPQGSTHISIPVDVFRFPTTLTCQPRVSPYSATATDWPAVEELWQLLRQGLTQSGRVVLCVRHDCAGASQELIAFAELIHAAIVTTQSGKSWINPYHPLAKGVFGFAGHATARQALMDEAVELILAVGTTLGQWSTANWDSAMLNAKLVHIHPTNIYFMRSPMARLHVQGPVKTIFQELVTRLQTLWQTGELPSAITPPITIERQTLPLVPPQIEVLAPTVYSAGSSSFIKPPHLVAELLRHCPPDTRFIADTGNWLAWTIHYLFLPQPEYYRISVTTAAMGWGIGSAVGTALGISTSPRSPVVCLTGDGCFLMHGTELTVAVAEQLPVVFVILADRSYSMVKHRHRQTSTERLEFSIPPVDFSLLAQSLGRLVTLYVIQKIYQLLISRRYFLVKATLC